MVPTPQLQPVQAHANTEAKGILRGSPKRKRRDSQEEVGVGRGFEPQLSQELEKAKNFAEINSHLKGERFSPQVLVTPKSLSLDMSSLPILDTPLDVGGSSAGLRRIGLEEVDEGASSPRTAIAKKLGKLDLQRPSLGDVPVLRFGRQGEEKERKKIRLEGFEDVSSSSTAQDYGNSNGGDGFSPRRAGGISWHHSLSFREKSDDGNVMEIPETPQPPAPNSHRGSPPPPAISPSASATILPATTFSPPKSANDMEDLTWQDSEITGHLALDPDDDGYGVNGIGFRPTPAMAYARSQRRRQQIMEWKNRESREARSRRAEERRRGMKIGGGGAEGEKGRAVRFLE
ncbi:hypothetical protein E2P81_ATG09189 [Venturia nashicola]|uniref:Uncharacterized protein n=1 Tax=Venturia nashicola TaxID=86259 RepID=A0A4Z1NTL4_9PEZI|nr:hypothetical protein E6O75_ATG09389 [Venturia nashicola]TLD20119.1 hypothetical protein E2P81_ATG09189 [Venturia nashicola]